MNAAPSHALSATIVAAIERVTGRSDVDPLLAVARQPGFDLQANFAMKLAKQLGEPPRDVAARVTEKLGDAGGLLAAAEVSGPGFVNLAFSPEALAAWATRALADPRLGVPLAATKQTITVDYSAPNVAKEMHVGHLRSTVIGDAIVRTLEFAGHDVIRMNHLGDWGTQFGMLTQHMLDTNTQHLNDFEALGTLYREAKTRFDEDPAFADAARRRVVALQAGDPATIALWQDLVDVSLAHINHLYAQLDVTLTDSDVTGESFYNDRLAPVDRRAARGRGRGGERGRGRRLLRAVHEPGRLARGADRAQVRRRLRLRRDRPRLDPLPDRRPARRPADLHHRRAPVPALPDGLRRRRPRRLDRRPAARAHLVRHDAG